jgi:hypothetical protein
MGIALIPAVIADLDSALDHPDREDGHGLVGRCAQGLATAEAELRAVGGAGHGIALQVAIGERIFVVAAEVLDGVELPIDMEDRNLKIIDVNDR